MQTMRHRKSSKIISLLLVMVLLCAMFPIRIFAEETGEVTVSTAKEFIQAVNSNNTWKITLAADVVIEYGMTNALGNWNSNYQSTAQPGYSGQPQGILVGNKANAGGDGSFVIDGQNQYKIIFKWPHTIVENGNFYFPNASKVKSFTMKDITWYGSSEVGCYFPVGNVVNDVQITFDHVTYKGPGMGDIAIYPVYKPQVLFRDCDITMSYRNGSGGSGVDSEGYGGSLPSSGSASYGALWQDTHASETIAANFITFEGNNTIAKQDSPADGGGVLGDIDPIFYIYWYGDSYVKVADDASLIIKDEAGKTKQSTYTTGLIGTHTSSYSTPFIVGENAVFEYHHVGGGNGFITDYYKLGSLIIGDQASVVFDIKADKKFNTNDVSNLPAYFTADSIRVGEGAKWTYVVDYAGSAANANNSMVSANTISIADSAEVNLIAKNNSQAESLITLRDSNPGISFTNPKNVVLFNSKSDTNSYVIKSSSNASLNIKTNGIRSWVFLPENNVSITGNINPGNQMALENNYITSPDAPYQWVLDGEQYSATLRSGANAEIINYSPGHGNVFNLSGTNALKNINVLELRAKAALTSGSVLYEIWDGKSVSSFPAEIGGPFPVSGPKDNHYNYLIANEIQLGSGEDHYIFDKEYTLNQLQVNAAISDLALTMSDTEYGLGTHTLYYAVDNRGAIPGTDPDGVPDYLQPYSTVKVFYSLYDGTVGDPQPVSERENIEIATLYEKVGSAGIYIAPKTQTYNAENYVFDDILTDDEWDNKGGLSSYQLEGRKVSFTYPEDVEEDPIPDGKLVLVYSLDIKDKNDINGNGNEDEPNGIPDWQETETEGGNETGGGSETGGGNETGGGSETGGGNETG
ncbi:pectate lyase-like adhesive domain-containing protein, partial [Lacrimispora sp.]|uniref:pectate lyase-like adhesive domain-containing protein n=1 Tax=Lacrimispora sp. TaxID=2719234 RepID=UPI0028AE58B8